MHTLRCIVPKLACLAFLMGCWACSSENDLEKSKNETTPQQSTDSVPTNKEEEKEIVWTPDSAAQYRVAKMTINTENGKAITSKEKKDAVNCTISIESDTAAWCVSELAGTIRGRGNSTWKWYPKKPYRIKLNEKAEILGLKKSKNWVLLANYRDPTDLMNTFVFELGQCLGMAYTNNTRYVEVTLNGDNIGLYQLTEQVEQGGSRVDVADDGGVLISLDTDDGPELAPEATDNFWSSVFSMPVCVKYPDKNPDLDGIKADLAKLERAIKNKDYATAKTLVDMESFMNYIIIQELVYNVELSSPRSIYMYHDKDNKWYMGPLWDFDAGYDFDWGDMYTGHKFFTDYKELVLGTSPSTHGGTYYTYTPDFFTNLFGVKDFVKDYQTQWAKVMAIIPEAWTRTNRYAVQGADAMKRDSSRWPIGYTASSEIKKMKSWLDNRTAYLDKVIKNYK